MGQGKAVPQHKNNRDLSQCLDLMEAIGVIVAVTSIDAIFILA